ncbi:MAG: ankyrin repeat domain-containing protein [Bacteroidetes bacterium]|nr:ankyrin repeat domain-containing protein [Bacteroidota bacterium]
MLTNTKYNDSNILNILLNTNIKSFIDEDGDSPLNYAIDYGQIDNVKLLIKDKRIDKNHINKKGETALSYAKRRIEEVKKDDKLTAEQKKEIIQNINEIITILKNHNVPE